MNCSENTFVLYYAQSIFKVEEGILGLKSPRIT